jgi:hypothetical protein
MPNFPEGESMISISARKLAANRRNALKSTGPKTADGKARSARNGIKHGLLARVGALAALGETHLEWRAFRLSVVRDLDPTGEVEFCLAEYIAQLVWQLRRAVRFGIAAAAVAFLPAAALAYADGLGPDCVDREPDPDGRVAQLRADADRTARSRDAASAAADLIRRSGADTDTEPVGPAVVEAAWRAACQSCDLHPDYFAEQRAAEFLGRVGVTQYEQHVRCFSGWDGARLRDGLTYLAERAGRPIDEVIAGTADRLDRDARDWDLQVSALERELARAAGELAASAVQAGLERARPGTEALKLLGRYQVRLGGELERCLRMLALSKAARPTRVVREGLEH